MKKTLIFIICALNTVCFSFGMERKRKNDSPLPESKRRRQMQKEGFSGPLSEENNVVNRKDKKNRASDEDSAKMNASILQITEQIKKMTITSSFTGELVSFSTENKK